MAQLCFDVRRSFREELLGLILMEGPTTGEPMFLKIITLFNQCEVDLQKVSLLVTDGAPAMIGRFQGLTVKLASVAPHAVFTLLFISLSCVQSWAVIWKTPWTLSSTWWISSSHPPAYNTTFSLWCLPTCLRTTHTCLFITMSGDSAREMFWSVSVSSTRRLCLFLVCVNTHGQQTSWRACWMNRWWQKWTFCLTFEQLLNTLNLGPQGPEKLIVDLVEELCASKTRLTIVSTHLTATGLLNFPRLCGFMNRAAEAQITAIRTDFLTKLTENFTDRFQGFNIPIEVFHFARDSFSIKPEVDFCVKVKEFMSSLDQSIFQCEMVDVQSSVASKQHLQSEGAESFDLTMFINSSTPQWGKWPC